MMNVRDKIPSKAYTCTKQGYSLVISNSKIVNTKDQFDLIDDTIY